MDGLLDDIIEAAARGIAHAARGVLHVGAYLGKTVVDVFATAPEPLGANTLPGGAERRTDDGAESGDLAADTHDGGEDGDGAELPPVTLGALLRLALGFHSRA